MGWQDAPVVGGSSTGGWANAPTVDQTTPAAPAPTADDSILGHLHRFSQGFTAATRAATDWPTFGLADKIFGQQAQADTAAAHKQLGAWDLPVSMVGSLATGGPELKGASMLGEGLFGGGRVGAALGSGTVGLGTGALGAYGHEQGWAPDPGDIVKGALISGGLNAAGGAISGPAVGRQAALPAAQSADDLEAAAKQAYAPLSNVLYDAKNEIHPHLDVTDAQNALRDWSGYKWGDASKTSKEIKTLLDKPQLSANDLQQSQSYLKGIAASPTADANDKLYAGYYVKKLQDALDNGVPQTGVPQNWTPSAPGQSYASSVKAAGDVLHGQAQDMGRLETMQAKAAVTGGPDVGRQSTSYLTSDEGQRFAPAGSPLYQGWDTVAGTAAKGEYLPWTVKHYFAGPLAFTAAGELLNATTGGEGMGHQPWWARLGEEGLAGLGIMGGARLYGGLTARANRLAQQRAIDALKSTITTGAYQEPLQGMTPVRNAFRTLLAGGSGAY